MVPRSIRQLEGADHDVVLLGDDLLEPLRVAGDRLGRRERGLLVARVTWGHGAAAEPMPVRDHRQHRRRQQRDRLVVAHDGHWRHAQHAEQEVVDAARAVAEEVQGRGMHEKALQERPVERAQLLRYDLQLHGDRAQGRLEPCSHQ